MWLPALTVSLLPCSSALRAADGGPAGLPAPLCVRGHPVGPVSPSPCSTPAVRVSRPHSVSLVLQWASVCPKSTFRSTALLGARRYPSTGAAWPARPPPACSGHPVSIREFLVAFWRLSAHVTWVGTWFRVPRAILRHRAAFMRQVQDLSQASCVSAPRSGPSPPTLGLSDSCTSPTPRPALRLPVSSPLAAGPPSTRALSLSPTSLCAPPACVPL